MKKLSLLLLILLLSNLASSQCSIDLGADLVRCWNGSPTSLTANMNVQTPGGAAYTLTWDNGIGVNSTPTVSPLTTTTYNVTMSDGNGCTATDQITVEVSHPIADAGPDMTQCQGVPVQLDGTGSGGTILGTLLYNWDNNVDNQNIAQPYTDINGLTTISLTVLDFINFDLTCASEFDQVSVVYFNTPNVNAGDDMDHCASSFPEAITITNFSNETPAGGVWTGSNVNSGVLTANSVGTTTLTYTYTSNFGCVGTDQADITVSVAGAVDVESDFGICHNSPAVQLNTGSGTWSGSPLVTPTGLFTPSTTGIHHLTYSEITGGCTSTDEIVVTVHALPQVDAGLDFTTCASTDQLINGGITVGSNPIATYSWSGGSIVGVNDAIDVTVNPSSQTTYTFTVTDTQGCQASDDVVVSTNPLPVVNAGSDENICHETPAQVINLAGTPVAGAGETGVWTGTGVTAAGVFTDPGVGTYTLTYTFTDANGCVNSDNLDVQVTSPNNIDLGPDLEFCLNDNSEQLPTPNAGAWSGTDVTPSGVYTPSTPGIHTLDYNVTIGSCQIQSQIDVTVFALPTADAGTDFGICVGSSGQLDGTGSTTPNGIITDYLWSNGTAINDNTLSTPTVSPATDQNYTLTVTDTQGCQANDVVQVTVNPLPTVDAGVDQSVCYTNPPAPLNIIGTPAAGNWTGIGVTANGVFTPPPGTLNYDLTYTFTDSNGCVNSDQVTVSVTDPANVDVGPSLDACLNSPPIQLTQPGTWTGSNVTTDGVFTPSTTGTHTLDFEVQVGQCTAQAQLEITVLELPQANAGNDDGICFGNSIQLNGTATTPNTSITTYLWSNGAAIDDPTIPNPNVSPGTTQNYTLTVTDNKGCTDQDDVLITVNPLPTVDAGQDLTFCNQPIAETLTGFSPQGGTWTGVGITNPSGEYTPSVLLGDNQVTYSYTDPSTNCTNTDAITISIVNTEAIDAGMDESLCAGDNPLTLSGYTPTTGISWTGVGITDQGGTFDPSVSGSGTYTITMAYGTGSCAVEDSKTIEVIEAPIVDAGVDQTVCIDATSFALAGAIPFGGTWSGTGIVDANLGTFDPSVSGTGVFTLTYTYTNSLTGCSNTATKSIEVLEIPVADFDVSLGQCQEQDLDLTNNSTGATIYNWDFGNFVTDNAFEPNYHYTTAGNYTITLTASNAGGCSSTVAHNVEVIELADANFTVSELTGCGSLDVEFTNTSSGDNLSYVWDLDNGQPTYNNTTPPTTTFTEDQALHDNVLYSITLTASNSCNSDLATINVFVQSLPIAAFTTDQSEYCTETVPITNTSMGNPTDFNWDFGGLGNSLLENPLPYNFSMGTSAIDYTISLEVSNVCGTDIATQTITILPAALTSNFTTNTVEGCVPLTIEVTDQSSGAENYLYNFGDGGPTTIMDSPSYTYNTAGTYVLHQEVSNMCNTEDHNLTITVLALPAMSFSSTNTSFCNNQAVAFENNTPDLGNIAWDFDDGNSGNTSSITNTFTTPGDYNVTLTGTSLLNGCDGEITQTITVSETPTAIFTPTDIEGCSPFDVVFTNTTAGNNATEWDFGDNAFSSNNNATHTFINLGDTPAVYTTTMTSTTDVGCADSYTTEITVKPSPQIDFELSEYESCEYPVTVSTDNQTTGATSYSWNILTQGTFTTTNPTVTLISPGEFYFTLIAQNNYNCTAVETQTYTIHEKPIVSYLSDINSGCSNLEVQFNNQTSGASSYLWDFGDGTQSTDESPLHIYLNPGDYDVKLKAFTNVGCLDSLEIGGLIEIHESPVAAFEFSPEEIDIFDPLVTFSSQSEGADLWHWDFGDGTTSVLANPEHVYEHPGVYPAVLSVINEFGCTDAIVQEIEVTSDLILFVPNSFTPNEDGFNDMFTPSVLGKEFTAQYLFQVYNKWGQVIFETKDPNEGWDGNAYVGKYYVPEGVYNWYIEFRLKDNVEKKVERGTVYLFR